MKKNIILIGAGGHAKSCIDVIENSTDNLKIFGLIEKNKNNKIFFNYKIVGTEDKLKKFVKKIKYALVAFGHIKNLDKRKKVFKRLRKIGFKFLVIKSKTAHISKNSKIGIGTIIMHGAVINAGAKIGTNCIINTNCTIEHDVIIGNNCHIAPGAVLNGNVKISDDSFVGSGAVIKENIKVSKNCIVGANSFLKKNLTKNKVYK